ncbi:hypothetical protein LSTR_LSTR007144 [Laodelphax striatellus]|uniref:G-protein coupled receptors family 2 profile 2 domain-containing protein n=1 Tax=Laodelphax striatellus TaxID=195883 RepID=A0A482WWW4_LAOST|nr:hypothetical protein LSTR_LSTR007144 [Laodelphax striatellus]
MVIQRAVFHVLIFCCVLVNSFKLKGNSTEILGRNLAGNLGDVGRKIVKNVGGNVGNKGDSSVKIVGEDVGNIDQNTKEHVREFQLENGSQRPEKHVGEDYSYHVGEKVVEQAVKIAENNERGNSTEQKDVMNDGDKIINNLTEKTKNNFSDEIGENFSNLGEKISTRRSKKSVSTSTTESNQYRNHIKFVPLDSLYTKNGINAFFNKTACGRRDENGALVGCFTKCCQENEMLITNHTCSGFLNENQNSSYTHSLYFENLDDKAAEHAEYLTVPRGIPCGEAKKWIVKPHKNEFDFFIYKNGSLKLTEKEDGEHVFLKHKPIYEYCIDNIVENGVKYRMAMVCLKSTRIYTEQNDVTNLGFVSSIEAADPEYYVLNRWLFFINGVIFSVILIVYFLLPQLRTLNGLCIICLSLSSAMASFGQAAKLVGDWDLPACQFIAYTVVFSFLASFFWLNVMCFDIFWVFSGLGQSQMQASKRGLDSKKFIYYSIYSWGWPTAITILIIAMESSLVPRQFFIPKPEFGKTTCFFQSKVAMWVYFYGPVAVILILNLFFFLTTTIKILIISKQTRVLNHDGNKRHDEKEKQRFILYFKLFLVMGITWLSEVISFHFNEIRELNFLWTITDIGNTLQGIPIFFIFVWKKKTLRLLSERFCPSMNFFDANQGSTKTRETTNTSNNNNNPSEETTKINSIEMKSMPPESNQNNTERDEQIK